MPDVLLRLLLIAAILLVADLVLGGGAMTMTGMSVMAGAFAHPLAASPGDDPAECDAQRARGRRRLDGAKSCGHLILR